MSTLVYIINLLLFITPVVANLKDDFVVIYILPDKDKHITEAGFELFLERWTLPLRLALYHISAGQFD